MADLIDRGALYEQTAEWEASALHMVEKLMHSEDPDDIKEWIKWSAILQERTAFKHDVADAPSVDAVPVVRCKDCKHQEKTFHADKRMKNGGHYVYFCDLSEEYSHVCLDDDFCSKGERKNDG